MSTVPATTPPVESKSAKKRKAKAEAAAVSDSPAGRASPNADSVNGHATEGSTESAYLKELTKNIRNLHKKIAASAKADSVVEQNPNVPLDELVAQKKLNADQRTQLLKKPQLQSQVTQLEEQHKHYQTFAQELQEKFEKEKGALIESYEAQLAEAKQDSASVVPETHNDTDDHSLTVITGFLHAAAAKRQLEDAESEEAKAFEGALLLVYQGNTQSLNTLKSLVEGSDEKVIDTEGNALEYTFAQIKEAALKDAASLVEDAPETSQNTEETSEPAESTDTTETVETTTDPTIANAGLTELEDTNTIPITSNGDAEPEVESVVPVQATVGEEGSNAVADATWDPQASITSAQTATGDDYVIIPRDPAETDTGSSAPAVQQSTSSWADETAAESKTVPENDGFEQVKRERGRGRGGHHGGRGGRGFDGRGRGRGRGEYRGRGRGGEGRGGRARGDRAPQAPAIAPAPQAS